MAVEPRSGSRDTGFNVWRTAWLLLSLLSFVAVVAVVPKSESTLLLLLSSALLATLIWWLIIKIAAELWRALGIDG
jgi:hypothetical protein